jgi:ABC-type glycerol-3-phosphate transport system substrate-binding protein
MRKSRILAIALVLVLSLTVWASAETSKPTIRFAHMYTDGAFGEFYKGLLESYVEANKDAADIKVEAEQGDNLRNKIKIDLAANNLPDAFSYWALSSLSAMIDTDQLLNIRDYLAESKTLKWESFPESVWNEFSPDGGKTIYGIPTTSSLDYFLYNKEIFDKYGLEAPTTMDKFMKAAEVLKANGIIPLAVGSKGGNPAHFFYAQLYYQYGSFDYIKGITDGTNPFTCPETLKAAQLVLDMAAAGVFPTDPIGSGDFGPAVALYNEGKAAMIAAQAWSIVNFTDEIVDKSEIIYFPEFADAKYKTSEFTVGGVNNSFVINKASYNDPAKHDQLVKMLDEVCGEAVYQKWIDTGAMTSRAAKFDYSKSPKLFSKVNDFVAPLKGQTNFWILMPDPVSQEVFSTACDELWTQSITAEQFCAKVQKAIDNYLKK